MAKPKKKRPQNQYLLRYQQQLSSSLNNKKEVHFFPPFVKLQLNRPRFFLLEIYVWSGGLVSSNDTHFL